LCAAASGAFCFLQAQHQSATRILASAPNQTLADQLFQDIASGQVHVGLCFSQLRREPCPVTAERVPDGFRLRGRLPWITGHKFFYYFLVGARLPDRQIVLGSVPFVEADGLVFSRPLDMVAFTATRTVTGDMHDFLLPNASVWGVYPSTWIDDYTKHVALSLCLLSLGTTSAALDSLDKSEPAGTSLRLQQVHTKLSEQYRSLRSQVYEGLRAEGSEAGRSLTDNMKVRAQVVHLSVRAAEAAVFASRGAACQLAHPAQRILRDAMMFGIFGSTQAFSDELATLTL
jgi:alkylation response protein AidB-like acyl-CoA dehydrogenase